ncbi:MAG: hypothetical protein WD749_09180 [Phycisphaerales bacterium]
MAGSAVFPAFRVLTEAALTQMRGAGLEVDVYLDLSHNENIQVICDGRAVIVKKIHLDLAVKPAAGKRAEEVLTRLKNLPTTSPAFEMRTAIMTGGPAEFARGEAVAVEVPAGGFDQTVVMLNAAFVPDDLKAAVAACRAKTRDAFNALPLESRQAMGMYRQKRAGANQGFELTSPRKERRA